MAIQSSNEVTACYNNICVKALGKNAQIIAIAFSVMLLLFGVAAIIKNN